MTKNNLHVVIAAGGTGGHMVPAEGVSEELKKRGYDVSLVTDKRGNAYTDIMTGYNRHILGAKGLSGGLLGKIKGVLSILQSTVECMKLYSQWKPSVVIGFGGYPSMPAVLAARLKSIPYILHEQNTVLGRVNRLMAKSANSVALSYADTRLMPSGVTGVVTGNPVRDAVLTEAKKPYKKPEHVENLHILIMGGSQGAHILSTAFPAALKSLPEEIRSALQVSHQARAEDFDAVKACYEDAGIKAEVETYFTDVPARMSSAHLVCSRAGASSLAEISMIGRPSILVPLAIAMDDHQTSNAAVLEKAGAAWVFAEKDLKVEKLTALIQKLFWDRSLLGLAASAAKATAQSKASAKLADLIEQTVEGSAR